MYKCHLCNLETKQLNGLMSRHYKKHCSDTYSKEQYKIDLLNHHGRPQKLCKICKIPTQIPKGSADYSDFHHECYLKYGLLGSNNPNFDNRLLDKTCYYCNKSFKKFKSQEKQRSFCSISCSTKFYSIPENQSEAKKKAVKIQKEIFRKNQSSPEFKAKRIKAMLENGDMKSSKVEKDFFEQIQKRYPDAINGHQLDFYSVDIWIPSENIAIDVQGNYWHNKKEVRSVDKRKALFFSNNRKDIKFYTIWESEIKDGFNDFYKNYDLTMVYSKNRLDKEFINSLTSFGYNHIIYTDELDIENIKHSVIELNGDYIWLIAKLRSLGLRVNVVTVIDGDEIDISPILRKMRDKMSMFYGSKEQILEYLKIANKNA